MNGSVRMDRADPKSENMSHSITETLDRTRDAARGEKTSVGAIVEALGHVSYGAVILVPALLVITPLSGIPGLSSVVGIIIALVSAQMLAGRRHLWLPRWILRRRIDSGSLRKALGYLEKPASFIDRHTRPRLSFLVRPPTRSVLQATCMICGLAMPFLELVPFSSSILGAAISFFAIALVVRDGMFAAIGLLFLAGAALAVIQFAG